MLGTEAQNKFLGGSLGNNCQASGSLTKVEVLATQIQISLPDVSTKLGVHLINWLSMTAPAPGHYPGSFAVMGLEPNIPERAAGAH